MPRNLLPDEKLIVTVHRHWIVLVGALVPPAALVVLALGLDLVGGLSGDIRLLLTLFALALAGLWLIVAWLRWAATSLTVTDQRVLLESGVFSRASKVIPLDRIQDVSTRVPFLGRLLGYGDVEIDAAGVAGAEIIDHVPDPDRVRDQVFLVSERLRRTAFG